jgi:methyl-accepting chemotaxis protein
MQRSLMNLSTRAKLFWAFGLMTLLAALLVVFAHRALSGLRESQRALYEVEMANVVDLKDIRADHHAIRANVTELLLGGSPARQQELRADIDKRDREIQAQLREVAERKGSVEAKRDLLREFGTIQDASIETRNREILPLLARGKPDEARALLTGLQAERDGRLKVLVDALVDHAVKSTGESVAQADQAAERALSTLLAVAAITLLAGIGLTLLLANVLARPLQALSAAAEKLAAGDLRVELPHDGRTDETGVLVRTFGQMIERLRDMMREVGEGVTVLASSASQITASTAQVAASSAQTASSVAETSATAEEVKQTAKVASDKAALVQESAQRSVQVSQNGLKAMDETIEAMGEIRGQMDTMAQSILKLADQGMAIGEIIATVNDLADQSNLLSVNAAIEAARAGEEGAGFRVVAQEIRSLAEQSKQATVQVRALLGDIQKATGSAVMATEQAGKVVRSGAAQSESAAQAIRSMVSSIDESAHAAAQIAASAQQQAVGMDQVAYAMQNINQASAQNVAASRQTEAAAQSLQTLGERLKAVVDQYQR